MANRLEQIREECAATRRNSWWGDYPVADIEWLIAVIDELLDTWTPPEEDDG